MFDVSVTNSRGGDSWEDFFLYGWLRGDVDVNGEINLQDAMDILNYMFVYEESRPIICWDAADVTDDAKINIADPIFLLYLLYSGDIITYKIPEPYDAPLVEDPTSDILDCTLEGFECPDTIP